jgi:hypothetical protein
MIPSYYDWILEARITPEFWHGSTDRSFSGRNGIHIGSKKAATQALEARIGVPAEGEWDGSRVYGETLLCGKDSLRRRSKERGYGLATGYNAWNVPESDYYPVDRADRATYSDGTKVPLTCRPVVFRVRIVGSMTNTQWSPHSDAVANGLIRRSTRAGRARSGFYYVNMGEDPGSISAVVPDGSFLAVL